MSNSCKPILLTVAAGMFSGVEVMAQSETAPAANQDFLYGLLIAFGALFLIIILVLNSVIKSMAGNAELWKPKNTKITRAGLILLLIVTSAQSQAAEAKSSPFAFIDSYPDSFWFLVIMNLFFVLIILVQLRVFRKLIDSLRVQNQPETEVAIKPVVETENAWWTNLRRKLVRAVPIEREEEIMTDHEYDGIRELDNVLPPWWLAMFYATIIFAFGYVAHYHVFKTGDLQIAEFNKSVQIANQEVEAYMATIKAQVDVKTVILVTDAESLGAGEKIYKANCVACHGVFGEGGVGPNFADEYWIHGGSVNDVFSIIKYGVPSKGMISWRAQLSPTEIQNVASYLFTFQGTNPDNQKEPQGEKYIPADAEDNPEVDHREVASDSGIPSDSLSTIIEI